MPTPPFHSDIFSNTAWRQRAARIAQAMDGNFTWLAACIMLFALCLQLASAGNLGADSPTESTVASVPPPDATAADIAAMPSCSPQRDAALQSHFMLLHMCTVERQPRPGIEVDTPRRSGRAIRQRMT
ncbi:hypothetical protein [Herbaspirillum sp.]|uniref:hypothetical protein n=1 Tax=Herbaspirillum sp. TaxID=1890675 RepID=UPI0031E11D95